MIRKFSIGLTLLSTFAVAPLLAQSIQVNKENRTIAVTATDSATAPADVASVDVGYRVYAPDGATAYANGSKISNAIIQALLDAGINRKSIQSNDQQLDETRFDDSDKEARAPRRYTLSQSWAVRVPAESVANVLDVAVRAGANWSGHIEWSISDDNALEGKAAAKALERARAVAANMAKGLGAKLGPLVYASNQVPNPFGGMLTVNASVAGRPVAPPPPPPPPLAVMGKEIEKSATVYAIFAIE